ncbi:SxtJ family membrane protein [Candidatus Thioglobus sp.]|nr:SxtJ family membrane protein [Candidatus Thioglobus sp.]
MSEVISHISIKSGSEKSFGLVFAILFLILAIYPLFKAEDLKIWALLVSVIFFLLAFLAPKKLAIPNKLWFKFGIFLGSIVAPIVMIAVYLITVLPTGIIMRLLGKDLLRQKFDKNLNTYWIARKEKIGSMKNQF